MTECIKHRGPDADGFYHDDQIALGHRRLSIIDLSDAANQPLTDASGRYMIIFNGEVYNYLEIRKTLSNYPFTTNGDTEVLLAAFATWGPSSVSLFKGMFAFCIWDKQERAAYLYRDRMGVKPLYYYAGQDYFLFASEIRAILGSGLVKREIDRSALTGYFSFQSFGYPSSPVSGIQQLEAGSYIKICKGEIQKTIYWKLGENRPDVNFDDVDSVKKHVRSLIRNSVERRLVSDVPVGAFLSGGIDSSIVVGMMAESSSARPVTFNISFSEKEYDESAYAKLVAKRFNAIHTTIPLKPDTFLHELTNALDAMDTPSADGINTYVVSKAIREAGITVALSGVGGDELFAGYPFFKQYLSLHKQRALFDNSSLLRKMASALLPIGHSSKHHRMRALLNADKLSIDLLYPIFRRILSRELIGELTTLNTTDPTSLEEMLVNHRDQWKSLPLLSQVSAAEYIGYTQHTLLKDTDQMSMASSLEVREPFFDHDLVEYVLHIPDELKKPSYPKSFLVETVAPMLPDEIVHRKKQGFLFPWQVWMKNELHEFCDHQINGLCKRDFVKGDRLQAYWNRFLKGDRSVRWSELWLFVVLGYWMEKNDME
jgi:asparagine synthase (glutamine-hydrolysing)